MKKRILTALMCAAVMLTTACDKSETGSTPSGSSLESSTTESAPESSTTESAPESSTTESAPESSTTESTPENSTTESAPESGGFVHGVISEDSYASEFLGIKAEFAEGWELQNDVELAFNNGIDDVSPENIEKALTENEVFFELRARSDGTMNVQITVEDINVTNGGKIIDAEEFVDIVLESSEETEAMYKDLGYEKVEIGKSSTTFLGSELPCVSTSVAKEDMTLRQMLVPLCKGRYIAAIIFSGADEDEIQTVMDMFSKI